MRKICSEALGTALLLAAVVGSGIMGERLAQGSVAIALLANSIATGRALAALILTFEPISGAHSIRRLRLRMPVKEVCRGSKCPAISRLKS
jgi:glycerol uptake facilitator-like aquaporin